MRFFFIPFAFIFPRLAFIFHGNCPLPSFIRADTLTQHRDIGTFEPVMREMGTNLPEDKDKDAPVRLPW